MVPAVQSFELNMKRLRAEEERETDTVKTANLLLSLSCGGKPEKIRRRTKTEDGVFDCKTCGRRFPSFQALGGHRTSHRQPRLQGLGLDLMQGSRPKTSVHQCSICGQRFSTGQALGGHMRRHKPSRETFPEKNKAGVEKSMLDLNVIPSEDDCARESSHHGVLLALFV